MSDDLSKFEEMEMFVQNAKAFVSPNVPVYLMTRIYNFNDSA